MRPTHWPPDHSWIERCLSKLEDIAITLDLLIYNLSTRK